tara:strand:+ start:614 stop:1756 length:1143 start_codon:yes stop_codon:yes gene_type:complete
MARKRIIYQSEALYAGATGDTSPLQLHRVQDVSHSIEVARQDINEFGKLAALSREVIEPPTVGLDFTYYPVDGWNEASGLGFSVRGVNTSVETSAVSGIMQQNSTVAEKNYYVLTVPEGEDASSLPEGTPYTPTKYSDMGVIGIGNGYITSYTLDAAVGDIPTVSASVEASNLRFDVSGSGIQNPAISTTDGTAMPGTVIIPKSTTGDLSAAALRPGDVTISFGTDSLQAGGAILPGMTSAGAGNISGANVQSFSVDLPLSRTPLQRLGNVFPFSRELDFPISATLSVTANLTEIEAGALRELLCNDARKRDVTVTMNNRCGAGTSLVYTFKGAILDSQNMSSTIGDNKSVELSFSTQIGGASDNENGVFISGSDNAWTS